ncbi:hypothetical protein KPL70_004706 [Citrus sinensis]|nr:hypothetical protein KPL70_004706 [Citrus sinensis]
MAMKTSSTSCSLLNSLRFSTAITVSKKSYYHYQATQLRNHNCLSPFPSFSSTFPRNYNFHGKCLHVNPFSAFSSSSGHDSQNPPRDLAVLLEVDGVLVDAYRFGNRQAFNVAFQKLGLDCANWTAPIYTDLLRKSAGDEDRMLVLFFNRKNALDEFLASKDAPLRPGVEDFVDDAYNEGIPLIVLTAYGKSGDRIARSVVEKLGSERISKIKIVGNEEVERSLYGQFVLGKGISSGVDEQLATEARKAVSAQKQEIAEEVASMLKLSVDIDTSSPESLDKIVAALRAGAEYAEKPVRNCFLIAGSQSGVAGAQRIGMPCVVMRSSLTSRAEFPSANAVMDGFGGADLTISKLRHSQW